MRVLISFVFIGILSIGMAQTAEQFLASGMEAYANKKYPQAMESVEKSIELDAENAIAFKLRGDIKQRMDDFEGALDDYGRSKTLDNDNPRLYISRSAARISLGNYNGAIRDLERAVKLAPEEPDAHFNLACAHYMVEAPRDAMNELQQTLKLNPDHADALFLRGVIRGEEYKEAEGLADIEKALSMNPDIPGGQMSAAILLYELEQWQEAADRFTGVIATADEDARIPAYYYRGDCYYNLDIKEEACKDFQRAARFGDTDAMFVIKQYCDTDAKRIKRIPRKHRQDTSIQF
jgi:tetratricopeptide (TPR) repeat protein